ncbi:MAG: TetR/AcrR family transcriptional regulator [Leptospira sp.]|nr:TetR/AcrR family transcriptional regulator [Leptospira sp.]
MSEKVEKNFQKIMHSFLDLLKSEPYDALSIEKIAKKSGMTRVNFYKYFTDKEDLLWRTFLYVFIEVEEEVNKIDPITLLSNGKPLTFYAFEHVKKHRYFYQNIFENNLPYSFIDKLLNYFTEQSFRTHEVIRLQYKGKIPYMKINEYLSGALFNMMRTLVREEEWDSLELSQFFTELAVGGLQKYIMNSKSSSMNSDN